MVIQLTGAPGSGWPTTTKTASTGIIDERFAAEKNARESPSAIVIDGDRREGRVLHS
jgi:hypothetical protein